MIQAVETFFAAWSISDDGPRREMITSAMANVTSYADPRTSAPLTDIDAISDYVGMFAQAAPGATAKVVKSDDRFGMIRATIAFAMAEGMVQHGQYFIEFDDGKISRMVGYVGTGAPE